MKSPVGPLALVCALTLGGGCDSGQVERVESQRLIAGYESLTAAVGEKGRRSQLAALRELPLRREAPKQARDLCVEAHTSLLDAEAEQDKAAQMLEKAITGKGGEPLQPDEIGSIQASIDRSEKALGSARKRFVECEAAVRDLAIRFGQRR